MGEWFESKFANLHSSQDFRRKSNSGWLFWIILIALGIFGYFKFFK